MAEEKLATMLSQICRLPKGTAWKENLGEQVENEGIFTGWYSLNRLGPQGPYESIIFSETLPVFEPTEGPLAKTRTQCPAVWCAVTEGQLCVADKNARPEPPAVENYTRVRGWYDVDPSTNQMIWHPIGDPWDENEITEHSISLNISYRLYKKVSSNPKNILFFGAGASFGSDEGQSLHTKDLLPPLGNRLYDRLRNAKWLKYWRNLPPEIEESFRSSFEEGMEALENTQTELNFHLSRDRELALFMSKYSPGRSNLYRKLAYRIAHRLSSGSWSGAIVTLNYECLVEEALRNNRVFPAIKGISFYDIDLEKDPPNDKLLLELCYPHGACHFWIGFSLLKNWHDRVSFSEGAGVGGNVGANHLLHLPNVAAAYEGDALPLIRRYQPSKRAAVSNYFLDIQTQRAIELLSGAEQITIVGVQCLERNDAHIWDPLAKTEAFINYVDPGEPGQKEFRRWANQCGKVERKHFRIIQKTFKAAYGDILNVNDL